eukprot:gnl/MRDRNA2_/MRDRNA2_88383_c0_seq1.p1 gnl/MRDRNA2_/MRDRNA2_88383_c0~~gnl/MRDRNA2_/MRDRNA2_88383_c0_seq1.p1  ORF type:complete len:262 (+),score=39.52 gnl/MRDRNA2_/MRDRNA2_88383_c0_seq1:78-863(+)
MGFGPHSLARTDSFARLKQEGLKRFHMWHAGREPKEIDISVQEAEFEVLKEYEVTCQLIATCDESECSSRVVGGFPTGTRVTILRMGSTRSGSCRVQVTNKSGSLVGWVFTMSGAMKTLRKVDRKILDFSALRKNARLRSNSMTELSSSVSRLRSHFQSKKVDFKEDTDCKSKTDHDMQPSKHLCIGETLETEGGVVLRETESMSSAKVLTLKGGCQMKVLELGKTSNNRVKVSANGTVGWVTILQTHLNEPLFAKRPRTI